MTINYTGEKSAIPGVCQNYYQKGADGYIWIHPDMIQKDTTLLITILTLDAQP